jgi:rRNA-processing protein FCF1
VDDEPMVTETVARRLERVDERRSVASATSVRAALDRPQG